MAFVHGKNAFFSLEDSVPTVRTLSSYIEDIGFPRSIETAETTAFGATAKAYITGLTDATISVSGKFDATADGYLTSVLGQTATIAWVYGPAGNTVSFIKYSGSAIMTSYEVSATVGDVVTASFELQVTGAITRGTF